MADSRRKVIIVTTTRADWGILSPLARELALSPEVKLLIAAGNMHLLPEFGNTVDEIRSDGMTDVRLLGNPAECNGDASAITADIMLALADVIKTENPQAIVILGDRYEMLGVASAALIASVPVVHIHGGEVTEGAIDDSVRHALTKMASLHLVATELSAQRVAQMGEPLERIVVTGSMGVENALSESVMSREELSASLDGFEFDPSKTLLVTMHPVTRHPEGLDPLRQIDALLEAIDEVEECKVLFTYPNNDPGNEIIVRRIEDFVRQHPVRTKAVKSLGRKRYLSAMRYVRAIVGNTSSGLLEAPSTPAATIDIGPRQQGRERACSVIHVPDRREDIVRALRCILDAPPRSFNPGDNPYYRANAAKNAAKVIIEALPSLSPVKKFKDLSV